MLCPRTGEPMKEVEIGGVKVDVSMGCGGVWFDNFELQKFDEQHESAGDELIKIMEQFHNPDVDTEAKIQCPRCESITLMRRFFSVKRHVAIDECAQCGGVWLDTGELLTIRKQYPTEEERNKAASAYIEDIFKNDPQIQAMKAEQQESLTKAKRFARMFRFICPSNYIPGDQDWGAF